MTVRLCSVVHYTFIH